MSNEISEQPEKNLDDILMAMDVVDTLRHSTRVVERELNASEYDIQLLERLRGIYEAQGINVPDHILKEGVTALREDRFTYHPTPPSFSRSLAEWYVENQKLVPFIIYGGCFMAILIVLLPVLGFLFAWGG